MILTTVGIMEIGFGARMLEEDGMRDREMREKSRASILARTT